MGLGGNLIWTSVFDHMAKAGKPAVACAVPLLSDLVAGRLYRKDKSFKRDLIFRLNPNILHVETKPKSMPVALLDRAFEKLISPDSIRRRYERAVFERSLKLNVEAGGPLLVHVDMRIHSYAEGQTHRKTIWKTGGNTAHVIAREFGFSIPDQKCSLWFSDQECAEIQALLENSGVRAPYIVVEPDTNIDWFGQLRAWPMTDWQKLVDKIRTAYPDYQVVQIGLGKTGILDGAIDLTGKTSFRSAALVMQQSALFLGTEGGLMHAAAAVEVPSVILWGGVTLPEFAGYPHLHEIVCLYMDCAPCGNLGWCDYGHRCMKDISVTRVLVALDKVLLHSRKRT